MSKFGKPLYPNLEYCRRCCMPETNEGNKFDDFGICQACRSAEQKIHINWKERKEKLREIFEKRKQESGDNYDCIIGISGGKDSTFQLHVITKIYGLNPLAVTFNHGWYNEIGWDNLWNALEKFDVDHVMFSPKINTINKSAKKSLKMIGDICWHCHAGIGSFTLQTAIRYKIPLIVWGESIAHASGRTTHFEPIEYDRNYFTKVSAKVEASQMVDDEITKKEMMPFVFATQKECDRIGIKGIFLSDYIFWDDEKQTEFVKKEYGWKEGDREGAFKGYKSTGCKLADVHDYSKFVKRGFGRGTDQASQDVRAGLLTREEGFELAKKYDSKRPASLDYYLQISGYTENQFYDILKKQREGKAKKLP